MSRSKKRLTWAASVDGNQAEIVEQLQGAGFDVDLVFRLPSLYDLVVSGQPRWAPRPVSVRVEVKVPGGALTSDEADYWESQRHPGSLIIARSVDDVLRWFGWI